MDERHGVRDGMQVQGAEGQELGTVSVCGEQHFLIESSTGVAFREDRVARYDQVDRIQGGTVILDIPASKVPSALAYRREGARDGGANDAHAPLGEAGFHLDRD